MNRKVLLLPGLLVGSLALAGVLAWLGARDEPPASIADVAGPSARATEASGDREVALDAEQRAAHEAMLDREFPLHGLVTAPQIAVRAEAAPEAPVVGWLRLGGRVRLRTERTTTPTCASGWYPLHPRGFVCAGLGVEVGEAPPGAASADGAADVESALPYRYLLVREPQVPEYHQLPSREAQRAATEHGRRYAELLNAGDERRAERLRAGTLPGEPPMPAAVVRYLQRNFYVASNGAETRSARRFVRTVRGSYIKEAQLIETTGSDFEGVELDDETTLPIAWAVRASHPLERLVRADGTSRLRADPERTPWERQERLPWRGRENIDGRVYHVLDVGDSEVRYLRAWFVAVAEPIERPRGIGDDEPWVHVDVGAQTLVVYRGARPIYATLVSSGLEGHDTPRGEFRVRRKFVSDTMANLGPDAGDDSYRIDDVPWTQYFAGSIALHGAFWHHRFGLPRSHGCVNLAPRDARWVFEHTWPAIPDGWHGVSTEGRSGFEGSLVLVTD